MENNNYEKWKEKYYYEKVIDMDKFFDDNDKKLMKQLGANMNYTKYEFERVKGEIIDIEESLEKIGVNKQDYDSLLQKFDKVSEIFY